MHDDDNDSNEQELQRDSYRTPEYNVQPLSLFFDQPKNHRFIKFHSAVSYDYSKYLSKAPITKRRVIGPIRTEISPYKIRKKVAYFPNC